MADVICEQPLIDMRVVITTSTPSFGEKEPKLFNILRDKWFSWGKRQGSEKWIAQIEALLDKMTSDVSPLFGSFDGCICGVIQIPFSRKRVIYDIFARSLYLETAEHP